MTLIERPRSVAACRIRAWCPAPSVLRWRPPGMAGITSRMNRSAAVKSGVQSEADGLAGAALARSLPHLMSGAVDRQHAEALLRGHPIGGPALLDEPALQRIGAEVL